MSYNNLGEFIARLEREGELLRVGDPVSPLLEIAAITDRMSKRPGGGKALFFEQVEGSPFPVVTNAFGSSRRIELAFGATPDGLAERLLEIINQPPPRTLKEKIGMIPRALEFAKYLPRTGTMKNPPCQEVVHVGAELDLLKLPILQTWPQDGGCFITLPVVFTKGLADGRRNAGMYRMQVYDKNTTGMHWHIHKDGAHHFFEYKKAGRRMEVAVAIGTDPAITYAATAPLPRGVDEMLLAGFIRRKPVTMVKALSIAIEVPAEAEFILEGWVDPEETRIEGPFGDHTGYYSAADLYPVFHLTAITHRKNPIYSATVVGRPPMEDCWLAYTTERLFLPMIRTIMPEITDYWLPWEGVFHNIAVVAIEKEYPGHAAKIVSGLWGSGQMSFAKALVIIDDKSLLQDGGLLFRHLLNVVDLSSDVLFSRGILDVLDHSAPDPLFGAKIAIDATSRCVGEPERMIEKESPAPRKPAPELLAFLQLRERGFLDLRTLFEECRRRLILIRIDKEGEKTSRHYIDLLDPETLSQGIFVLYDKPIDLTDNSLILWKAFNNVDPGRDIIITAGGGVVIDATRKGLADGHPRPWPDDIETNQEITSKWERLFG